MDDLISRKTALHSIKAEAGIAREQWNELCDALAFGRLRAHQTDMGIIKRLPSAQPEQLTDTEQRIFLAAMAREEEVCKQTDNECRAYREPYEDSLVSVCHEITRKVKGALWTI